MIMCLLLGGVSHQTVVEQITMIAFTEGQIQTKL